ncbi:hypothetical protein D037_0509B, partial [Vibrio parahaemolyticus IDH02640]
HNLPHRGHVYH